ncbi:hypothetical protein [Yunchengibacter salinarum]|uniref:hypothetical protein n=1 Tax=Yunchengibacter salinarum TaxID=3133399 RepID=UPI0035B681BA
MPDISTGFSISLSHPDVRRIALPQSGFRQMEGPENPARDEAASALSAFQRSDSFQAATALQNRERRAADVAAIFTDSSGRVLASVERGSHSMGTIHNPGLPDPVFEALKKSAAAKGAGGADAIAREMADRLAASGSGVTAHFFAPQTGPTAGQVLDFTKGQGARSMDALLATRPKPAPAPGALTDAESARVAEADAFLASLRIDLLKAQSDVPAAIRDDVLGRLREQAEPISADAPTDGASADEAESRISDTARDSAAASAAASQPDIQDDLDDADADRQQG